MWFICNDDVDLFVCWISYFGIYVGKFDVLVIYGWNVFDDYFVVG